MRGNMENIQNVKKVWQAIDDIKKVIKGKDESLNKLMCTMLAGGHILMEDIPGVGKTTLALAFSKALSLKQKRMQFTPDVLPSDVCVIICIRRILESLCIIQELLCVICFLQMRLTVHHQRHSLHCLRLWKKALSQLMQ